MVSQGALPLHNLVKEEASEYEEGRRVDEVEWVPVRLSGRLPERRSNFAACVDEKTSYLYIFGGRDINFGLFNNLWRLSLNSVLNEGVAPQDS